MWPMLAMAGVGLLQSQLNRSAQADANKANAESAAAQTRFSPYTKMNAGSYQAKPLESGIGGAMTGAASGLQLSQAYNKSLSDKSMMDRMNMGMDQGQMNQFNAGLGQQAQSPWAMSYGSNSRVG